MILITHCYTRPHDLEQQMGMPDYSYRFVLDRFRPVLERLAPVTEVVKPKTEIDAIHDFGKAIDHDSLFLSFNPPQQTLTSLRCPTIPVFAWEFDDLPDGAWAKDPRNGWHYVLEQCGRCITHSTHAADVVRKSLGTGFPVHVVPAPLPASFEAVAPETQRRPAKFTVEGRVTDSHRMAPPQVSSMSGGTKGSVELNLGAPIGGKNLDLPPKAQLLVIDEGPVVYTAIFNPRDGRKNWRDLVNGFCVALGDQDAVLVLKVFGSFTQKFHAELNATLRRLAPTRARVIAIDTMLDESQYLELALASSYAINTSHGEGQCLPLMEYMALGKPAVAPAHTGMLDYLDEDNGFPFRTSAEPASWPQDPTHRTRTSRQRIDMEAYMEALSESFRVATGDRPRYEALSKASARRIRAWAGADAVERRLRDVLSLDSAQAA